MTTRESDTYLLNRGGSVLAGRYRVLDLLAVGGMGSVWVAEQIALRRPVVVKFHEEWTPGDDAEVALERFLKEGRALAAVRHRNVTELFEVGRTSTGEPYLIMERLRGRALSARMRMDGTLPVEEAISIAWSVLHGLEAVHAAGILHRDVKPENIFLHEEEGERIPKLLDFGLARSDEEVTRITDSRRAMGTPGYMAPEQARGKPDLDGRVDLYATGVTLYEMLSGELPAKGESAMDLLLWTAQRPPIPLAERRPDLEGPIGDAVMRALAMDREDRYPTARAMWEGLEDAFERSRT